MPLTTKEILQTVAARTGMDRGRAMALHRRVVADRTSSGAERRYLAALLDVPPLVLRAGYEHPERAARPVMQPPGGKPFTLTAADIAWIVGLPSAENVTYADAVQLASLAAQTRIGAADPRSVDPAQRAARRLVESKWAPVKAIHDRHAAEAELAAARCQLPAFPRRAALDALNAAIERETTELSDDEGRNRADVLLDQALRSRAQRWQADLDAASQRVSELAAERAHRATTVAPLTA
jgi:hypothetical protein